MNKIGIVIIGRNEGDRLRRCLTSVLQQAKHIVYVDSGSSDDSVSYSKANGIDVVELDMNTPFSAARARNEGFLSLTDKVQELEYIQFIDGDCELTEGWIQKSVNFLEKNPKYAIVAGQRKERFPEKSIYNLLCDIEWNTPIGDAYACGGDFLVRCIAFKEVSGFNPLVVAGEEPELSYRLRNKNWKIYRLDKEMTLHDAAMTRFSQWWSRAKRTGHAYAQGSLLHLSDRQGYYVKESLKDWLWALIFPVAVIILALSLNKYFLFLMSIYIYRFIKIFLGKYKQLRNLRMSFLYGIFTFIANWPQLLGHLLFLKRKIINQKIKIIEHK